MVALRFRWRLSEYMAISPRDVRRVQGRAEALEIARAMLQGRSAWSGSRASLALFDEESLADAIESGRIVLVKVDERPRLMDAPRIMDLVSLASPFDPHAEPLRPAKPTVDVPPTQPVAPVEPEVDRRATYIELHDVCFGRDRSLMVPAASTGERQSSRLLGALIVACGFVQAHPDKLVLVAGHTDTTGSDAHNQELAARRATNVQLWLSGQREAWAADCQESYQIADFKAVHRWAYEHLGWSTDPGPIDESWDERARVARDVFRRECEALLGVTLERGVKQNTADWEAIHDLYALVVSRYLDTSVEELAALRTGIHFLEPATLACGERFPRERPHEDGVDSAANRRVELLFFDPAEVPDASGDGSDIYEDDAYAFERLVPESLDPLSPAIFEIDILLYDHWHRAPLGEVEYTVSGPVPECLFERRGTTDARGALHETMLPSGHYELRVGSSRLLVMAHPVGFSDPSSPQPGPKFPDVYRVPGQGVDPVFPPRTTPVLSTEWEVLAPGELPEIDDDDVHVEHPDDRGEDE